MMTISKITNAGSASRYFEGLTAADQEIDPSTGAVRYFAASGEPPGRWRGNAAALGRQSGNIVKAGELERLLYGQHPETGESLVQSQAGRQHRPGWDLTFSAPKSVSAIWAADPELRQRIEAAHEAAVEAAFDYLQQNAAYTRRGKGGGETEKVDLIGIEYQHSTSRAQDPHLHSHLLIANVARREDGTWGTIESRPFYQHRLAAGALYQAELAARLRDMGFEIQRGRGGTFEVAGVPGELKKLWSQRHEQMAVNGATGQSREAERAFLEGRPEKGKIHRPSLFARWETEAAAYGLDPVKIRNELMGGRGQDEPLDWGAVREKLTEDRSTFRKEDILRQVAQRTYGQYTAQQLQSLVATALSQPESGFVRLGQDDRGEFYTTVEHLAREKQMLERMGRLAAADSHAADAEAAERAIAKDRGGWRLSDEQAQAVRALSSGSRIATTRGAAGTGKTTSMIALREAYEASGYKILGATISNQASRVLQTETGIESMSIAKLLYELSSQSEKSETMARMAWDEAERQKAQAAADRGEEYVPKPFPGTGLADAAFDRAFPSPKKDAVSLDERTVILVDEAGMVDTPQLARLIEHAETSGAKIVLIGDERQIQAVGAGGGFAAARQITQAVGGDAELTEVRRQKVAWQREAAEQISLGQALEALRLYEQEGRLHTADGPESAARELVEDWMRDRLEHKAESQLIIASSHAQGAILNRMAQETLRAHGLLGPLVAEGLNSAKQGQQSLYRGDEIRFSANRKKDGWINGDRGVVVGSTPDGWIRVKLENGKVVEFDPHKYRDWQLSYSVTAHKSQGSTVDRAYYLVSSGDHRELGYVAASRHKQDLRIYVDQSIYEAKNSDRDQLIQEIARSLAKSDRKELALSTAARAGQDTDHDTGHSR